MRGRAAAARLAHNQKVAGSSPAPATKKNTSPKGGVFFLYGRIENATLKVESGISPVLGNKNTFFCRIVCKDYVLEQRDLSELRYRN